MNQTLNDSFKKDLPNLHQWCEEYVKRTGIRVFAGNPPVGLVLEEYMGRFNAHAYSTNMAIKELNERLLAQEEIIRQLKSLVVINKAEKTKK